MTRDPDQRPGTADATRGPACFTEDELVPLSALQHFVFCPRQCALIHLEDQWLDNRLTVEGTDLHERVDETGRRHETRGDLRITRGLALVSFHHGLVGRADLVEMHRVGGGPFRPLPVEYKRGKPKPHEADRVQLCAQALCLEEMLGVAVPCGALFYGQPKRRLEVDFDDRLRAMTVETAHAVHAMLRAGHTPRAHREAKCRRCSLEPVCMPTTRKQAPSARQYLERALQPVEAP